MFLVLTEILLFQHTFSGSGCASIRPLNEGVSTVPEDVKCVCKFVLLFFLILISKDNYHLQLLPPPNLFL